jgi:hypothetical protein
MDCRFSTKVKFLAGLAFAFGGLGACDDPNFSLPMPSDAGANIEAGPIQISKMKKSPLSFMKETSLITIKTGISGRLHGLI